MKIFVLLLALLFPLQGLAQEPKSTAADEYRPFKIVTFGDGMMTGYGLTKGQDYATILNASLRKNGYNDIWIINRSVSGDTTELAAKRLKDIIQDKPDLVLIELGINDAINKVNVNQIYFNLRDIIKVLYQNKIRVLLMGMKAPADSTPEYAKKFSSMYKYISKEHKVPLYPYFLDGVAGNEKMLLLDKIHPNRDGIKLISEKTTPYVAKMISVIRKKQ